MKKYIITLLVLGMSFTGKAMTKAEMAKELVHKDRAYTWFVNDYKRGLQKVYGIKLDTAKIIESELTRHESKIKALLVKFYEKNLTKGEMLSLTMPYSMLKPREWARLKSLCSTVNFLTVNDELAESISSPIIAKLDIYTWAGTDKLASVASATEKSVTMK